MKTQILGIKIDDISSQKALEEAARRIRHHRFTAVVTPNPTIIYRAMRDPALAEAINASHLQLPDGIGLHLAARILDRPLSHRVAGIEFGEALLSHAVRNRLGVYFLGGRPGVAERAAEGLCRKYPGLIVRGTHHGYFSEAESPRIAESILDSGAQILFVCLGSPRQELWIDTYCPRSVSVAAALGGSLDVWAGDIRRAPHCVSAVGMEWLWRMLCRPRRFLGLFPILGFFADTVRYRLSSSRRQNSTSL